MPALEHMAAVLEAVQTELQAAAGFVSGQGSYRPTCQKEIDDIISTVTAVGQGHKRIAPATPVQLYDGDGMDGWATPAQLDAARHHVDVDWRAAFYNNVIGCKSFTTVGGYLRQWVRPATLPQSEADGLALLRRRLTQSRTPCR